MFNLENVPMLENASGFERGQGVSAVDAWIEAVDDVARQRNLVERYESLTNTATWQTARQGEGAERVFNRDVENKRRHEWAG